MKITLTTVSLMLASLFAFACDICGGIGSNVSVGMLLNERFHVFGFRSVNRMSTSYLHGERHSGEYIFSQELYSRLQFGTRTQVIAALPIQTALQKRDMGNRKFSGIGDPYAHLNTILFDRRDSLGATATFLSVGAGAKAPLGSYALTNDGLQNLYPGTGAWDGLLSMYLVQRLKGRVATLSETTYTLRTRNPVGFRFGNMFSASSQITHYAGFRGNRLLYAGGVYFEHFSRSVSYLASLGSNDNSGYVSGLRLNATYLTRSWLMTSQLNIPVFQELNEGNVKSRGLFQLGIHYLINLK